MNISEVISKQILSLYESETNLVIYKPIFSNDLKRIKGYALFDIEEKEYFLPFTKVHSISDLITIKNLSVLEDYVDIDGDFIGVKVYNSDGEDLGHLIDVEVDDKGYIKSYITTKKIIKDCKILKSSNCLIFYGQKDIKNIKPKLKDNNTSTINNVSILSGAVVPTKEIGNTSILIGRKITKDVYANNAEIIAKKDQYINEKILVVAKKHNKINQLFFSSI